MSQYTIMTDSGCDISPQRLESRGVRCVNLSFRKADGGETSGSCDMPVTEFYKEMRKGTVFQTSAVNPEEYIEAFDEVLKQGSDLLYICLSSGLSCCVNSAELAAKIMMDKYPGRRIEVIDSLCASAGLGLLVYLAVRKKNEGADLDAVVGYNRETAPRICHRFTVDDLKYLKRGGRIGTTAAFAATVLDIRPVLYVDDAGRLVRTQKVRGRRRAIQALAEKYRELAADRQGIYFISHGDCPEDAKLLESLISRDCGSRAACITDIGPVIGAHSGPGTLALFFIGKQR